MAEHLLYLANGEASYSGGFSHYASCSYPILDENDLYEEDEAFHLATHLCKYRDEVWCYYYSEDGSRYSCPQTIQMGKCRWLKI